MPWIISLVAILFISVDTDLLVSAYFFHDGHFLQNDFLSTVYAYGPIPGFILLGASIAALFIKSWRREGIYLILVLAIGSGVIAHGLLKEGWPRPRPKQLIEFGGHAPYQALTSRYIGDGHFRSFPSGHATMGYYFLALVPIGRRRHNRYILWTGILGGVFLGALLSYTRIAQGGHFLSDTLASCWVMAFAALLLSPLLLSYERPYSSTT